MLNFREWKKINEDVPPPVNADDNDIPAPAVQQQPTTNVNQQKPGGPKPKIKTWKAGKEEILKYWKGIAANLPLLVNPIPYDHEGTTIQEDGIRITGSKEFITSVLSRLKDFITFENPNDKLVVSYRQSPKSFIKGNKNSYSFYLQVKQRGKKN